MSTLTTFCTLKKEISVIKQKSALSAPTVTLLGASKMQSAETVEELIQAGLLTFGENRVQEAQEKWPGFKKRYPHIELHLIGPLQTNKVKAALELFDVIQTVDRPGLVEAIAREMRRYGDMEMWRKKKSQPIPASPHPHISTSRFYLQVNTGNEPQKAGVAPEDVDALLSLCQKLRMPVTGLMCVPPVNQPPAPHFALLYEIAKRHGLAELSMGMSGDYETAIRMGSTCVRIGTKLFGERVNQPS